MFLWLQKTVDFEEEKKKWNKCNVWKSWVNIWREVSEMSSELVLRTNNVETVMQRDRKV